LELSITLNNTIIVIIERVSSISQELLFSEKDIIERMFDHNVMMVFN